MKLTKAQMIDEFKKEKVELTKQAEGFLNKAKLSKFKIQKLIKLTKERKFKIAGGDVLYFLSDEGLPTSLILSKDVK